MNSNVSYYIYLRFFSLDFLESVHMYGLPDIFLSEMNLTGNFKLDRLFMRDRKRLKS